jgi:hypothetical protein
MEVVEPEIGLDGEDPGYYDYEAARMRPATDELPDWSMSPEERAAAVAAFEVVLPLQRRDSSGGGAEEVPDDVSDVDAARALEALYGEFYGAAEDSGISSIEPGDLVLLEDAGWVVVEDSEVDQDEGQWLINWRSDDDDAGQLVMDESTVLQVRRPVEALEEV